ncbi:prolyl oligopeptidase family protein [Cellulomonas sp. PhB143]|uniref:prolyl oligopeptidase family serine peptidase n=1 Tax=Cellulomonas sp. PhB143 TaxID=2485186 RepID=UPI000F49412C|nr:prolyl oligopeptidase family serine peptidase [Cellulomonas sp. PhB143]ROS78418.1 prolyl oligopeptidase [Cellulomonas sp. PhB143]
MDSADDPYLWLEDVEGERALAWVRARNHDAETDLASTTSFATTRQAVRDVLDSDEKIPAVSLVGGLYYNVWRDAEHPRGLWRRTTPESYRAERTVWETVLDLDALSEAEGESWVWHGASVLRPDCRRALVDLSPGGSDADVTREYDLLDLRFVPPEEGGFARPAAKGGLGWIDEDTVYAWSDFGPGTMTASGYPRTVRRWRRGAPLDEAEPVFEGTEDDLYVMATHSRTPGFEIDLVRRSTTFYSGDLYVARDGGLVHVDVPVSAEAGVRWGWLMVQLRDDWTVPATDAGSGTTYRAGSLLAVALEAFLAGERRLTVLFDPAPTTSLAGATWTRHHLVVTVLDDVRDRLAVLDPPPLDSRPGTPWARRGVAGLPELGTVGVRALDADESDDVWLTTTGYLTPTTLALLTVTEGPGAVDAGRAEPLKAGPTWFDAGGMVAVQHFAVSDDGTRVPYVAVGRRELVEPPVPGTAARPATTPTVLYGYGGFEISLTPAYSGTTGRAWLARGGVHVVANIRGGGEYGPAWHQAALREHRHRAYEDFAAVARDLVARGITSPGHLAAQGGSNGGLLAGNMLVTYPELFGAVVISVPLLDMRRYTKLLAGASWAAEYGDPDDPAQWEHLRTYSPYHLLDPARAYPPVLLTTSTRDDRVHPGHARKMAAAMLAAGKDVTYFENVEGGHGGAADNAQAAYLSALAHEFLAARLGLGPARAQDAQATDE